MSSAATTVFCAEEIDVGGGFTLWIDGNGKITASNGTLANPKPNAFSLVQIKDCPGSTPSCRAACYVHGLEKHAPDTHKLYVHNSETIRAILRSPISVIVDAAQRFGAYVTRNVKEFRWHVSGDVFSMGYADFIARVCQESPLVKHWIYTRSFKWIHRLVVADNLVVNLSADKDNYREASRYSGMYDLRVCYFSDDGKVPATLVGGDVIFPDYSLRGQDWWWNSLPAHQKKMVCPVDFHGKTEKRRCGPCDKCMK